MLRVIAGEYRSRKIKDVPSKQTRPTTDKNKEVLFNAIGQFFDGGRCLDLYAGSGALGIEALSRGMDHCTFVDKQRLAVNIIYENIQTLKIDAISKVIKEDAMRYLHTCKTSFDLILIDPPYKLKPYQDILTLIHSRHLLNKHGIIVMESDQDVQLKDYQDFVLIKVKDLGNSKFSIFRRETR